MLILLGMLWSRSSKGNEGMSPSSMRARLNAAGDSGSGIGSNDIWSEEGFSAVVVSDETSTWLCWLVVPETSPKNFEVSSSGGREEEANDLFASSGVFGETDEESSAITSKKPAGLDAETVCPSYEPGYCG